MLFATHIVVYAPVLFLHPDSVAEALCRVLTMPADLIVHDLTLRPMVESNF